MKIRNIILPLAAVSLIALGSCSGDGKTATDGKQAVENTDSAHQQASRNAKDNASAATGELVPSLAKELGVAGDLPLVIDFNATWCGPCKQFAPIFEAAATKYKGKARFVSVDVDEKPDLAQAFNVESIPEVVYVGLDDSIDVSIGMMTAGEFDEFLTKNLK